MIISNKGSHIPLHQLPILINRKPLPINRKPLPTGEGYSPVLAARLFTCLLGFLQDQYRASLFSTGSKVRKWDHVKFETFVCQIS